MIKAGRKKHALIIIAGENDMSTTLGANIKLYRKNKGITQEEMSDLLKITPQAISKWESGTSYPDVSMLVPIAQVLGVSTDTLLGYDAMSENQAETERIRAREKELRHSDDNRAVKRLRICEFLSTETNLNPGNFEIIKDYVEMTADLSMFVDPVLEGYFQDQMDHIREIYKDCIRKGAFLISHCTDRDLVIKTHYAMAWIYIHEKDFDHAREHISVLPSIRTDRIKEKIDMELTYFESGFDKMKVDIKNNAGYLFDTVSSMLNTIAQNYGWWGEKEEALEVLDWCEAILKAFKSKKEYVDMDHYLLVRKCVAFFRLVALKKAGDDKATEESYLDFIKEIQEGDYTEKQKADTIKCLEEDIAHYSNYSI